jgi:hypothetical protein
MRVLTLLHVKMEEVTASTFGCFLSILSLILVELSLVARCKSRPNVREVNNIQFKVDHDLLSAPN